MALALHGRRALRSRVVVAEYPAVGQGVLVQLAGRLMLTEVRQVSGEVVGCGQGVGVVFGVQTAGAGQEIFIQMSGLGILSHLPECLAQADCSRTTVVVIAAESLCPL